MERLRNIAMRLRVGNDEIIRGEIAKCVHGDDGSITFLKQIISDVRPIKWKLRSVRGKKLEFAFLMTDPLPFDVNKLKDASELDAVLSVGIALDYHCAFCKKDLNSSEDQRMCCGKCPTRIYCSSECQKADWPTHRRACKDIQCAGCNAALGSARFFCGNCKEEAYCGLECQKKQWPTHKHLCCKSN
jgi:hypothetical protein